MCLLSRHRFRDSEQVILLTTLELLNWSSRPVRQLRPSSCADTRLPISLTCYAVFIHATRSLARTHRHGRIVSFRLLFTFQRPASICAARCVSASPSAMRERRYERFPEESQQVFLKNWSIAGLFIARYWFLTKIKSSPWYGPSMRRDLLGLFMKLSCWNKWGKNKKEPLTLYCVTAAGPHQLWPRWRSAVVRAGVLRCNILDT